MRKRKWQRQDLPVVRKELFEEEKAGSLVEREPIRVIPVEVKEVKEVRRAPNPIFSAVFSTIVLLGKVAWTIVGFWLGLALLARLLGF